MEYFSSNSVSDKQRNKLVEDWKLNTSLFTILLPGRLTEWKGQEMFIESLNYLLENHNKQNFHAIILGSDQGRKVYLKKLFEFISEIQVK